MTPKTLAEEKILLELPTGEFIEIGPDVPDLDAGPDRSVRASFLRWLVTGAEGAPPLHAKGLRIEGALIEGDGTGAETPGLDLEGCTLPADLGLVSCRVPDPILLRSARLRNLFLNDSHLAEIMGDRLQAAGGVFLRSARVEGTVRLLGARLGGDLSCTGATLRQPDGDALFADRLQAEGGVFLSKTQVEGTVRLLGARLGGDLACVGATLRRPGGDALVAAGLQAAGYVFLRETRVEGTVCLIGARLGGNLECTGATLRQPDGDALFADRLQAEGGVFLSKTQVEGTVRLLGARLGGELDCIGATLRQPDGFALVASNAEVRGALFWVGDMTVEGGVDLRAASFRAICDHRACWPEAGKLFLDRCSYGAFVGDGVPVSAKERIDWLGRQYAKGDGREFRPQPWEQCAKVLREMGHAEDAREILIDKEERLRADRRRRTTNPLLRWALLCRDWLLKVTIRYGQRPLRAGLWLLVFWGIGLGVFGAAWQTGQFKPNSASTLASPQWVLCGEPEWNAARQPNIVRLSEERSMRGRALQDQTQLACFRDQNEAASYPAFNLVMYAFDVLIPVINVAQRQHWVPDPACDSHWDTGLDLSPVWDGTIPRPGDCIGWWAKGLVYLNVILGWALSLLAVAGFSGLVKSD